MILALLLAAQADFAERKLGEIPQGARFGDIVVTPDGRHAAYTVSVGQGSNWIARGEWRSKLATVLVPLGISADGLQVLYLAGSEDGTSDLRLSDKVVQSFDHRKGQTWRGAGALTPDGGIAVLPVGHQDEGWWTYSVNGKNGRPHKLMFLDQPRISLDGKTIAGRGTTPDNGERVIVNDVAGPLYEEVIGSAVSENGVVIYVGLKENGDLILHHGDKMSKLDSATPSDLFLSADGTKLGFVYSDKGRFVKVGAKIYPKLKMIYRASFDSRSERVVFWGIDDAMKLFVGVDDWLFEAPGIKTPPVFSPDGSKVGYAAEVGRELRWKVIDLSK